MILKTYIKIKDKASFFLPLFTKTYSNICFLLRGLGKTYIFSLQLFIFKLFRELEMKNKKKSSFN